jgi:predicted house-cleaning noncanonical NTP pyrophosphatase (MazG superfamily)
MNDDLVKLLRKYPGAFGVKAADRIEELERQLAKTYEDLRLAVMSDSEYVKELEEQVADATDYATRLAKLLRVKHFPENNEWQPLPDLMGVLTQIDNMTTAWPERVDEARNAALEEAATMADEWGDLSLADAIRALKTEPTP